LSRPLLRVTFALLLAAPLIAGAQAPPIQAARPAEDDFNSSTPPAPATPENAPDAPTPATGTTAPTPRQKTTYRPFSAFAIGLKIGTGGIGAEVATPLNRFINLRGSFQVFDHPLSFRTSGIYSKADLTIQNAQASVDIYPFPRSTFHISPGVTLYGDNHLTSNLTVPGGSAFLLGPDGYTSDPADPVTGIARIRFGNPVSPRFTIGWGNMLPRNGGHFSVPFEIGFQYIAPPTVTINLYGSVCDPGNNCGPVNSGTEAQDLQTEINELNADLQPLRFYPIISIGLSYKFGHSGKSGHEDAKPLAEPPCR